MPLLDVTPQPLLHGSGADDLLALLVPLILALVFFVYLRRGGGEDDEQP